MRRRAPAFALLVLALLGIGHWIFWYRPRERPAAPSVGTLPGAIFEGTELPYRVWIPYPHQNLATLEHALGDTRKLMASVAEMTGREMPGMPSFGAARIPPSSELLVASDQSGERFLAVARVYPVAGQLARWAGRLAGNPLLSGGSSRIDGRPVEVRWIDGCWVVATAGVPILDAADTSTAEESPRRAESLAWLALSTRRGRLPPGAYRLRREADDLVLDGGEATTLARLTQLAGRPAPLPLLTLQSGTIDGAFAARSLGLLPGVRSIGGLPGAITAWRGPRRWRLPGERVLELIGDGPPRRRIGDWRVVALEEEGLGRGRALVEFLEALESEPSLSVALWVEIRQARRLADQVAEALEAVPVVGRREARRWRAASEVMVPLTHFDRLTALVSPEPPALVARLSAAGPSN